MTTKHKKTIWCVILSSILFIFLCFPTVTLADTHPNFKPVATLSTEEATEILNTLKYNFGVAIIVVGVLYFVTVCTAMVLVNIKEIQESKNKEHHTPLPIYENMTFNHYVNGDNYEELNNQIKELVVKEKLLFETETYQKLPDTYKIPVHLELVKQRFNAYSNYPELSLPPINYSDYLSQSILIFSIFETYNKKSTDFFSYTDLETFIKNLSKITKIMSDSSQEITLSYNKAGYSQYVLGVFTELKDHDLDKDFDLLSELFNVLGNNDFLKDLIAYSQGILDDYHKEISEHKLNVELVLSEYQKIENLK